MNKYHYLVGFFHDGGTGTAHLKLNFKIETYSNISELNKFIEKAKNLDGVAIFTFKRLKGE